MGQMGVDMENKVLHVASYILAKMGDVSTWKLQKLVYYSQAWNLVWNDFPLFEEPIQAWANGPVCPVLYEQHKGRFLINNSHISGDFSKLTKQEIETIDKVIEFYGGYSGQELSDISHSERPWMDARRGLEITERGNHVITHEAMSEFYSSIPE